MSDDSGAKIVAPAPADLSSPRRRWELFRQWDVLAVISAGGVLGALARYGIGVAWPTPVGAFPKATLTINVVGCAAMGVLMVLITEVWAAHRLVRPFLGTGVLGGFTTFSTYAVDTQRLISVGAARTALLYLAITPVAAVVAVWIATVITRQAARRGIDAAGR
jgi:fluoride exporter